MRSSHPIDSNNSFNAFPTGNYPPFGYNDNNFNRQRFPSNRIPPSGGIPGNPLGHFNPVTSGMLDQMNNLPYMSRFNHSYSTNPSIIEPIDYSNKNNTLHNNIGGNVIDEHVVEYRINIDSLDRDIKAYPNPFNFTVKFNAPSSSRIRTESIKNGTPTFINDHFDGPPLPHINKEFRNVKYIKLDNVVIPQYSNIIFDNMSGDYIFDPNSFIVDDRYISLVIKELDCNRVLCTSDNSFRTDSSGNTINPERPFATIFPDKLLGNIYYTGIPYHGSKFFKNSLLGNITQLSIQFNDSCGFPLQYNHLFTYDDLNKTDECTDPTPIPISDLRHPLNKNIQVHLSLVIGVVESQINNNIKFEF